MVNLVQISELLKGMPDTALQKEMMQPTGQMPPFLVAAEAARRQDIRVRHAPKPGKTSVIDDLIAQTSIKNGVAGLASGQPPAPEPAAMAQAAPPGAPQGVNSLPMQAAAGGGQVQRRYQFGGHIPDALTGGVQPQLDLDDQEYIDKFKADPYVVTPPIIPPSYIPPSYEDGIAALKPLDAIGTDHERGALDRRMKMDDGQKQAAADSVLDDEVKPPPQPQAAKSPEETEDEYRDRLAGMAQVPEEDSLTGIRGSEWFAAAAAFQNPNKSFMAQLADAGGAVSSGVESRHDARKQAELERERMLWDYDFKKHQATQGAAAEEAKYQRTRQDQLQDNSRLNANQVLTGLATRASNIDRDIRDLRKERAELAPEMAGMEVDPATKAKIAEIDAQLETLRQQALNLESQQATAMAAGTQGVMSLNGEYVDPLTKTIRR